MESYLEGKEPSEEDLIKCVRKGTLNFNFVPILTGSAFKNKGVQPLLDAVIDYLPSPSDLSSIEGTKVGSDEKVTMKFNASENFSALAFKVANDPFVGSLTFIRIYSGTLNAGTSILNSSKDKNERIGRMLLMHANSRRYKDCECRRYCYFGWTSLLLQDTLYVTQKSVLLEPMEFPDPVIEIAVEPKTKGDQEKMGEALARLAKKIHLSEFRQTKGLVKQ